MTERETFEHVEGAQSYTVIKDENGEVFLDGEKAKALVLISLDDETGTVTLNVLGDKVICASMTAASAERIKENLVERLVQKMKEEFKNEDNS